MKKSSDRRATDYTNRRFGKLTALEPTGQRKNGYIVWNCRCDCGNEIQVPSRFLKNGWRTDCGCVPKIRYEDLTGRRFGKLIVERFAGREHELMPPAETRGIEALPEHVMAGLMPSGQESTGTDGAGSSEERTGKANRRKGGVLWFCRCDCGGTVLATSSELRSGNRKSCGCLSRPPLKDWVGKRFGRLTVISYDGKRKGSHYWNCQCDCGKRTTVTQSSLQAGHTRSCGCMVDPLSSRHFVEGTCIESIRNREKLRKNNTSGVCGVYMVRNGVWAAQITFQGKTKYLGRFDSLEEAAAARKAAEAVFDDVLDRFDRGEIQ